MSTYSFMDVTASFAGPTGIIDLGAGSGLSEEGITVAMAEEKNSMKIGADGEVMHCMRVSKHGTVTVKLQQTSPSNKKLSLAYNAQSQSSATWGNNVIVIRNSASGDITTARGVAFKKLPDHANAKEGGTVSWEFECAKIDQVLGEF
ncbi:DUF3277 family protein [Enterobacteriaceae bacterium BIT-l23]|jgi:hypothetical protein|uniref:phage structural protein n=1 Tax=Jejubacter sp. L23 TaxID=3092086 RepID=UPI00158551C4|nr:DUF3277 family protein [Enterobacteriaceae bacterium BIT-l23]